MVEEAERLRIRRGLAQTGSSVTKTAELLGISRKTLWEKLRRLQIENVSVPVTVAGSSCRRAARGASADADLT